MIIYFNHPKQVCMTYYNICCLFAFLFIVCDLFVFIHGIHPDLFIDSTSTLTKILSNTLKNSLLIILLYIYIYIYIIQKDENKIIEGNNINKIKRKKYIVEVKV